MAVENCHWLVYGSKTKQTAKWRAGEFLRRANVLDIFRDFRCRRDISFEKNS